VPDPVASGDQLDLSKLTGPTVDKHSTGGVGDGTTLVVGPLAAELGMQVVKLSGRGLGHTGGTLDKLESIPGLRTDFTSEEVLAQVSRIGLAITAQTADLVPADRAVYAVRDVTATVGSVPLIASSIMSKKLAGGAQTILLDVKTGSGAFMKDVDSARELARACVQLGEAADRRTGTNHRHEPASERDDRKRDRGPRGHRGAAWPAHRTPRGTLRDADGPLGAARRGGRQRGGRH
jgi:pyrimidine-nucleoside phosphorylase